MSSASATPRRRTPRYERLVNGKAVHANGGQRCCSHPQCSTKLSRYNPDETCNLHGGWTDESVPKRGRKPRGEDDPYAVEDDDVQRAGGDGEILRRVVSGDGA